MDLLAPTVLSVLLTPRPPFLPGQQDATGDLPQDGCVNDTSAPWLRRCWAVRREYVDMGAMAASIGVSGRPEANNYYIHAIRNPLLCSAVMPDDCIAQLGVFACFYSIFPRKRFPPSPVPRSPPPLPLPAPRDEWAPAGGDLGRTDTGSSGAPARGVVIGGVVGGAVGGEDAPALSEESPITNLTPPRADMHMLGNSDSQSNEVTLLPDVVRGRGSFGRVVEGFYQGQRVAVKLLPEVHAWGGASVLLLDSFAQEVEVLGRCHHPNVVRLLAACLTPPRQCLVLELMETSLERLLYGQPCGTVLPLRMVLHIATCIAKGLAYLHPTIVHRDLKPGNVLLNDPWGPNPVVKLADFGLARLRMTAQPTERPEAGTPAYLAPEGFDVCNTVITHHFVSEGRDVPAAADRMGIFSNAQMAMLPSATNEFSCRDVAITRLLHV
ncbi:hypothetical protein GPECTOR_3g326 [Gonium pectorale]|uniref:Protein kinase domain-containing protein n=1 Tax=Gonium pectorale TaxID=33097 RepID=A0A150H0U2_GONPE|nr:hypothetical protein GPECTOR_3g326 [Gonium pectorale]|eukprot:KXZ55180.1 hypothetical protein GPECTOR_3g326 [Gonium pectorale]